MSKKAKKVSKNASGHVTAAALAELAEPKAEPEPTLVEEEEAPPAVEEPEPTPVEEAAAVTDEEQVYLLAVEQTKAKGSFTYNSIWHVMSPQKEDAVWYAIKEFLLANPDLFERVKGNNLAWVVKGVEQEKPNAKPEPAAMVEEPEEEGEIGEEGDGEELA